MKYIVTGGAGFIGHNVIRQLEEQEDLVEAQTKREKEKFLKRNTKDKEGSSQQQPPKKENRYSPIPMSVPVIARHY